MAARPLASSSKPAVRQLRELLKEQQEPFILQVYLSEKGCRRKGLTSGVNFMDCHGYSCSFLNISGSHNKSNKGIPNFSKVVKVLCNKLFAIKSFRDKNHEDGSGNMDRNDEESAEADRFSSASSTTVYNSCSESDLDEAQIFAENSKPYNPRENKGSFMKDSKQHSPVSVLEEISSSTTTVDHKRPISCSRRHNTFLLPNLITQDSALSDSLWNLLLQTTPAPAHKLSSSPPQHHDCWSNSSPLPIPRRVLQQTKQLLFDCVKELVQNEGKGKEFSRCDKIIKAWGKPRGDESNINQLLRLDVNASTKEWIDFESQEEDIGMVIGNAILEEVTTETVIDLVNCS